jgi:hypothetical protein
MRLPTGTWSRETGKRVVGVGPLLSRYDIIRRLLVLAKLLEKSTEVALCHKLP